MLAGQSLTRLLSHGAHHDTALRYLRGTDPEPFMGNGFRVRPLS